MESTTVILPGNKNQSHDNIQGTFKHYDILEEVGSGGMGHIYKAYDKNLDRIVAIKVLKTDFLNEKDILKNFCDEAKLTARLRHPNIAIVYDVGFKDNIYYIVMDYVEGETLSEYMKKKLSLRKRFEIIHKILLAIDYAHKNHIVHCDLKPSNIIIEKNTKKPIILDFGIAKNLQSQSISSEDTILGTLGYMAPEQISPEYGKISAATDIYAMGGILYEWITERKSVEGDNNIRMINNILHQKIKPPTKYNKNLPKPLEDVCMKALEKKPENRYRSARAFAEAIDNCFKKKKQKKSFPLYIISPVILVLVTISFYFLQDKSPNKLATSVLKDNDKIVIDNNQNEEKSPAQKNEEKSPAQKNEEKSPAQKNEEKSPAQKICDAADLKQHQGKINEAILLYDEAISMEKNAYTYNSRGFAYYSQGNLEKALEDYNAALLCDPNYVSAYNNRGLIFLYQRKFKEASADFTKATEGSNNATFWSNLGLSYFQMGNFEKALKSYDTAIFLNPNFVDAYINRGYAYFRMNKIANANADYFIALQLAPRNETAYRNRGEIRLSQGDYNGAVEDYSSAIQINPFNPGSYLYRGFAYLQTGNNSNAIINFSKVIDLDPNHPTAYNNRGLAYYNSGMFEQAITDYNYSLKINSNLAETYFNRGVAFNRIQAFSLAEKDFQQYLLMQPSSPMAKEARAFLQAYQKQKK